MVDLEPWTAVGPPLPGCRPGEVARLAQIVGGSLPNELVSLLTLANGQRRAVPYGMRLLQASEIEAAVSVITKTIEPAAELSRHLVPFAGNDNGCFLAVFAVGPLAPIVTTLMVGDFDPIPRFTGVARAAMVVSTLLSDLTARGCEADFEEHLAERSDYPACVLDGCDCDRVMDAVDGSERDRCYRLRAASYLVPIGDSKRIELLIGDGDPHVRAAACDVLRAWPDDPSLAILSRVALEDTAGTVKIAAASALRCRSSKEATVATAALRGRLGAYDVYLG